MKEPPSKTRFYKQQQQLLQQVTVNNIAVLLLLCLLPLNIVAAPAPEPSSSSSLYGNNYGASFISNPSIYSYTVSNQAELASPTQQQQQQQQQFAAHTNLNNNYINFATNTQEQHQQQQQQQQQQHNYHSSNTNRNYYYTNIIDATSQETPAVSVSSVAASTLNTPTHEEAQTVPTQPAPQTGCTLDRLAVYKVVLHTYWTRDLFPKHYPDWRPTAQWTKTLGRTHNAKYALYHIGQQATPGIKQFAETGKTEILDSNAGEQQQLQQQQQQQQQNNKSGNTSNISVANERSVFDEFTMPAIQMGAGRSEAKLFVDSNHSLVSLMTRIVPSPDWYIGVDSFELCVGGSWIDTVTVEVDPLDAGTDNGFTFTAPNWPTSPQGVIYRITSRYPAHPAGSFYYPKSKRLPPIATFQFIKLKEYELSEVFNFAEDDRKYEMVKTQTHLETEHNHVEMNNELSASIERERQSEFGTVTAAQMETEHDRIRSKLLAKMNPMNGGNNYSAANVAIIPKNDKHALMQSIANSYKQRSESSLTAVATSMASSSSSSSAATSSLATSSSSSSSAAAASSTSKSSSYSRRRFGSKSRRRDCRVSHWTEWSPCSKSCGIGEMHRYRRVIKHGKRGGRPCPALQESKWCGTERGCHAPENYFNWSDT